MKSPRNLALAVMLLCLATTLYLGLQQTSFVLLISPDFTRGFFLGLSMFFSVSALVFLLNGLLRSRKSSSAL